MNTRMQRASQAQGKAQKGDAVFVLLRIDIKKKKS